ncbi:cobalamin biosynthesis protein [Chromatium okenii]|uniref:cobalamin biosynthesis protein n=1 Tax=Chromatium okenii TaxID=61644 RepID=UPI001F5B183D|nr:cobalamin biosynthesis protein [Chromatium okenii]
METAIDAVLARLGAVTVRCLASHERKADEPALLALAAARGWPIQFYSAAQLSAVVVPNPSARVAAEMVTPSVAEAAALLASGNATLLVEKCVISAATVKRHAGGGSMSLTFNSNLVCRARPRHEITLLRVFTRHRFNPINAPQIFCI